MFWAFTVTGAAGLLLGLRFRMASVLAASAMILAGAVAAAPLAGWPLLTALAAGFGAVFALQGGYLAGLLLWCASSRASWPTRVSARDAFRS